jgi:hypothetical protein
MLVATPQMSDREKKVARLPLSTARNINVTRGTRSQVKFHRSSEEPCGRMVGAKKPPGTIAIPVPTPGSEAEAKPGCSFLIQSASQSTRGMAMNLPICIYIYIYIYI